MSTLSIQPSRIPLVDPKTGLITPEWYRFFNDSFARMGGASAPSLTEVVTSIITATTTVTQIIEDAGMAPVSQPAAPEYEDLAPRYEAPAALDDLAPSTLVLNVSADDLAPPIVQAMADTLEYLQTEVRALAEQLAAARTEIQDLKQGTML